MATTNGALRDSQDLHVTRYPLPLPPYKTDSHYNYLHQTTDGRIWFAMSSHLPTTHCQLLFFDPTTEKIEFVADIGRALDADADLSISQGKVHVKAFEWEGWLYGATHIGYYDRADHVATPGRIKSRAPYPGGLFFKVELGTGQFQALGTAPPEEGIISMVLDRERSRIFGLTWPSGRLLRLDLNQGTVVDCGAACGDAEVGLDCAETVCRGLVVDPRNGCLYWSRDSGNVMKYDPATHSIYQLDCLLGSSRQREIWRTVTWDSDRNLIWAILARSGRIVRLDVDNASVKHWGNESAQGGPLDAWGRPFTVATLGFNIDVSRQIIYALIRRWHRARPIPYWWATVELISFDLEREVLTEHGKLRTADGTGIEKADALEFDSNYFYSVGRINPSFGARLAQRGHCLFGRDSDAFPGRFEFLSWQRSSL